MLPQIMGIVNVTPDSFSDGGDYHDAQHAIDHGLRLEDEGADILDIGGESTRPGSDTVSVEEELRRVLPVIEGLRARTDLKISIDTRKPQVMQAASQRGVDIINDVSALTYDDVSMETAAQLQLPVVLMHAQGDPKTMQNNPVYDDVVKDVYAFLEKRINTCIAAGMSLDELIIDPGIGFGKTLDHNLTLLKNLEYFKTLGVPLLIGASRKRFIGALTGVEEAKDRMPGSVAAALVAVQNGAHILRVHDVAATKQALTIWQACQ